MLVSQGKVQRENGWILLFSEVYFAFILELDFLMLLDLPNARVSLLDVFSSAATPTPRVCVKFIKELKSLFLVPYCTSKSSGLTRI